MKLSQDTIDKVTVTVHEPEPWHRVLEVTLPADETQRLRGVYLRGMVKDMTMPGFRKGKIPLHLLERQLGETAEQGLAMELGKAFFQRYIQSQHFPVVREAKVDFSDAPDGGLVLRIEADVVPPFEMPPYKGLPARMQRRALTESDIAAFIEERSEQLCALIPKKEPLAAGDAAQVRMQRVAPGGLPLVGESPGELLVRLSPENAPEELVEGLVGLREGDTTRVAFPAQQGSLVKGLRGPDEEELYTATVVKALTVVPPRPEQVAAAFGLEDPEELPVRVRVLLEDQIDRAARAAMRDELVARVARNATIHLAPAMVDEDVEDVRTSMIEKVKRQGKEPDAELNDPVFFAERHRDQIRHGLKELLVVEAIAEAEGLTATPEQVRAAIEAQAREVGVSPRQAGKRLDEDQRSALRRRITRINVERFLEDEAEVESAES